MITICPQCGAERWPGPDGRCPLCKVVTPAGKWIRAFGTPGRKGPPGRKESGSRWPRGLTVLCPGCGARMRPLDEGGCTGCDRVTSPDTWIVASPGSIPPVPGVGDPDPRICPECGHALRWFPGEGNRRRSFLQLALLGFFDGYLIACGLYMLVAFVASGSLGVALFPFLPFFGALAVGLLGDAGVLALFVRSGGLRFASEGVVTCPDCGYLRIGRETTDRDRRTRDRAVALYGRLAWGLLLPPAFFVVLLMLAWVTGFGGSSRVIEWGRLIVILTMPGVMAWRCLLRFRPPSWRGWWLVGSGREGRIGRPSKWEEEARRGD